MRAILPAVLISIFVCGASFGDTPEPHTPRLLLTPQRVRRLKRDRERQTIRWMNFETRVKSFSDSSERGFELALYYAVTGDEAAGRQAIEWALAHLREHRQVALVADWCGSLLTETQRQKLSRQTFANADKIDFKDMRDRLFVKEALQPDEPYEISAAANELLSSLPKKGISPSDSGSFYALCEYLDAVRSNQHKDLRRDAVEFFSNLPSELLLSMKPAEVEHPSWLLHCAALALVTLDPNLESSQYLQGWAMEDGQTLREGPGVAYEFLWGDPYLPGVSYQNLDPWLYDAQGRLFARSDWRPSACWISISPKATDDVNCQTTPWRKGRTDFGRLALIPFAAPCTTAPSRNLNEYTVLWQLPPEARLEYKVKNMVLTTKADTSGLLRVPEHVESKLCLIH